MSSGALNPIENPAAWDVVIVGQATSPGHCKIGEIKRGFEFDVKKGKGALGATITFVGRPPAKCAITFYLWLPQHFTDWDKFRPMLKYDPTKKAVQAIDIYHPSLADIELNSVVVESIGNIVHEGQQYYSIVVEFLEYFPPPKKSAVGTPTGSRPRSDPSGASGSTSSGDPVADAQQKEIAALLKQATAP